MLITFHRKVIDPQVEVEIHLDSEGQSNNIGKLTFPTKQSWTKFYGALSRGALGITDLAVAMENVKNDQATNSPKPKEDTNTNSSEEVN